jgi:ATP-dependent helicase Lhr and Lhr-like helicase
MHEREIQSDRDIATRLGQTWPAFFQRFGRLTPVQRSAIPPILTGESVLVASATASGKTEAACAPLLERNLTRSGPSTVLYVSPTRALVNDLYERLTGPCQALSIHLARRTGEHKTPLASTPDVLVTTPESFDSLLCRGRTPTGHVLAHTRSVVLDEIHLLDGTARGEQVRWLLERLRRLLQQATRSGWASNAELQIVALSATVAAPERVRDRFLPTGRCLVVQGQREIEIIPAPDGVTSLIEAITAHLRTSPTDRKILIFCNARREVDDLTQDLRASTQKLDVRIHAHHGSLAQRHREAAEEDLKSDARVIVVATSTLEIGIDVGDIDLVVLNRPAPDVPALLQRVGRGNRRTGTTRVMPWSHTPSERLLHSAMLSAAQSGVIAEREDGPQYGVIRQQLTSYVFQSRRQRRTMGALNGLCDVVGHGVPGNAVLAAMLQSAELVRAGEEIGLGATARDAARSGEIHSTIESPGGYVVTDATGKGDFAFNVKHRGGPQLGVGGNRLNVERIRNGRIEVRQATDRSSDTGEWSYAIGPWFVGAGQPQALRAFLTIPENHWPYLKIGSQTHVFHFGGGRRRALLQLLDGLSGASINGWFAVCADSPELVEQTVRRGVPRGSLRSRIAESLGQLERQLGRPLSNNRLPDSVRTEEVLGWLEVDREMPAWAEVSLVSVSDPEVQAALQTISRQAAEAAGRRPR